MSAAPDQVEAAPASAGPQNPLPPDARTPAEITCSICGAPLSRYRTLYSRLVCRRCWNSFINRRQAAFIGDLMLWFGACRGLGYIPGLPALPDWALLAACLLFAFKDGFQGMSPGKWLCGIQVVDRTSLEPIGFWASFRRNIHLSIPGIYWVCALIVGLRLGNGPRWGDGWARTMVIWCRHAHKVPFDTRGIRCTECGYDLTGNVSGICPECGRPIPSPPDVQKHEQTVSCPLCGTTYLAWQLASIYLTSACLKCIRSLLRRRGAAFGVDSLLICGLAAAVAAVPGAWPTSSWLAPPPWLGCSLVALLLLKDSFRGTSPGKWLLGLQTVNVFTGRSIGPWRSIQRNLIMACPLVVLCLFLATEALSPRDQAVSLLWFLQAISVLLAAAGMTNGRRFGDRWANTLVMGRDQAARLLPSPPPPLSRAENP